MLAVVITTALLVAGCSGGAGSAPPTGAEALPTAPLSTAPLSTPGPVPSSSGTPAASATPSGVTATGAPAVRDLLARTIVTAADLPTGFAVPTTGKPADDPSGLATQRQVSACAGGPPVGASGSAAAPGEVGRAGSVYERTAAGAYEEVSSLSIGFAGQAQVSALVSPLFGADAQSCFDTYFRTTIEAAGYTIGSGTVSITPGGVTPAVVGTVSARYLLTGGSGATTLSADLTYLVGRDIATIVSFYNLKAPVNAVLRDGVVATVAARMGAAG